LVDLVLRTFLVCADDEEIDILRGMILEALIIACHGGAPTLSDAKYGWGATVNIITSSGTKTVKYICQTPTPVNKEESKPREVCKNRQTIDFGYWNGRHAAMQHYMNVKHNQ
jgi:hypothetical protein